MGPSSHTEQTRYVGLVVQSSLKGVPVVKLWGTQKVGCNLIDYLDFSSQKQSTGGKGGGGNASYTYKATLLLGICKGPIAGVRTIYKDQSVYTATAGGSKEVDGGTVTYDSKSPEQAAGITEIFTGGIGQAPWSYLQSSHADHALGYSGLCYAGAYHYPLNSSATSPNHNFEVQSPIRAVVNDVIQDDANPADIIPDLLSDVDQWPAGAVGDLSAYSAYCMAQGLLLSPLSDQGRQASDLLTEILTCSNSDALWEDGQFKVVPYGDTTVTGNGVTFTPDLTPIYTLTWDDIIPNSAGEDPIQWDVKRPLEAYNYVQVGYLDRTQQYASDTVSAIDQASINTFGRRKQDPQSFTSICLAEVAQTVCQLMVQKTANVRRTAEFLVSELFGLLSPMDLINVPLRNGGVRFCRIVEANEQDDGSIQLQVEEMLVGAAHAALYTRQSAAGQAQDASAAPPDTNPPVLWVPPVTLTGGDFELWLAAAGAGANWGGCDVWVSTDGTTYAQVGSILQGTRFGSTTSSFPAGSDPDTSDSLEIDLTASSGVLTSATTEEADGKASLALVGQEIIAFSTVTQTGAYTASLGGYIRRGLYGTTIAAAPAGAQFVRLDDGLFKYGFTGDRIGQTIKIKLPAFNSYGRAVQDLSLCQTYSVTLEPPTVTGPVPTGSYIGAFPNLADAIAAGFRDGDTYYDEGLKKLVGSISGNPAPVAGNGALSGLDRVGTAEVESFAIVNGVVVEDSNSVSLGSSNPGSPVQVASATYGAGGAPIIIDALVTIINQDGSHDQMVEHTLLRDGTQISEPFYCFARQNSSSISGGAPYSSGSSFFDPDPPAGTRTYSLQSQLIGGTGGQTSKSFARLTVQEQKNQA